MENLRDTRIGQECFETRRRIVVTVELYEVRGAIAGRQLYQARTVAVRIESKRLGIDRDTVRKFQSCGEIAFMQRNFRVGHERPPVVRGGVAATW